MTAGIVSSEICPTKKGKHQMALYSFHIKFTEYDHLLLFSFYVHSVWWLTNSQCLGPGTCKSRFFFFNFNFFSRKAFQLATRTIQTYVSFALVNTAYLFSFTALLQFLTPKFITSEMLAGSMHSDISFKDCKSHMLSSQLKTLYHARYRFNGLCFPRLML